MPQIILPESDFEIVYERLENGEIKTTNKYLCGCEWSVIWEDITRGKVREVDCSEILWCEEHDPTIPRYDSDWDLDSQWEYEETGKERFNETYGDGDFDD